jgi:hypothetical protein
MALVTRLATFFGCTVKSRLRPRSEMNLSWAELSLVSSKGRNGLLCFCEADGTVIWGCEKPYVERFQQFARVRNAGWQSGWHKRAS